MIYQGHHGDRGATLADVVLPGAAYTEKNATYVNTEGRPQRARLAVFPPGQAKEDWKILRALSESLGHKVPLDSIGEVRARMAELAPQLVEPDLIRPAPWQAFGRPGKLDPAPFVYPIADFYRTDPISRSSTVMAGYALLSTRPVRAFTVTGMPSTDSSAVLVTYHATFGVAVGVRPYTSRSKRSLISARRRFQSAGVRTGVPSSNFSGSGRTG